LTTKIRVIAVPWYRREDYGRILQIMADTQRLPPTFANWMQRADELCRNCQEIGIIVEKAFVDPDRFPVWCRARGLKPDGKARHRLATEVIAVKHSHLLARTSASLPPLPALRRKELLLDRLSKDAPKPLLRSD